MYSCWIHDHGNYDVFPVSQQWRNWIGAKLQSQPCKSHGYHVVVTHILVLDPFLHNLRARIKSNVGEKASVQLTPLEIRPGAHRLRSILSSPHAGNNKIHEVTETMDMLRFWTLWHEKEPLIVITITLTSCLLRWLQCGSASKKTDRDAFLK